MMSGKNRMLVILTAAVAATSMAVAQSAPRASSVNRWEAAGEMLSSRAGACAAALPEGRVLVTGGQNETGILSSAEILGPDGVAQAAPAMSFARAGHVCVALKDGSVLVAGGRAPGNSATPSAERFDPATGEWESVGWLSAPRAGATAAVLRDGRVVVVGGEYHGALLPSIEIYDPEQKAFAVAGGTLRQPRIEHAAAALREGRVVIAGGTDGKAALDTIEIFDPRTGEVSAAGTLSSPRAGLTATPLLDGRVFFAGGSNGAEDLASTELFDPSTGRVAAAAPMDLPRRGHIALRVPDNNSVLIFGGTWQGEPLPASGVYIPWRDVYEPMARLTTAVTAAAGTALSGKVVMAGGAARSAASGELYSAELPTIRTDKEDYAPGESVTISGENWLPGGKVDLVVRNVATGAIRWQLTGEAAAAAAPDGKLLVENAFAMTRDDLYQTFELVATEQGTGRTAATWTFTDAPKVGSVVVSSQSPDPVTAGNAATYTITVNRGSGQGSSGNFTADLLIKTQLPQGVTYSFSPNPVGLGPSDSTKTATLTLSTTSATPAGAHTFTVKAATSNADYAEGTGMLIVQAACVAPVITAHPVSQSVLVGQSVAFSVTATGTGTLSYQWYQGSAPISGATSDTYTIPAAAVADAGSYSVEVTNSCGTTTSNAASLTVTRRSTSLTLSFNPNPVVIGQSSTVTVTVTDTSPDPKQTPTGTVTLTAPTDVTISGTCELAEQSLGTTTCTVTASASAAGEFEITAKFEETAVHQQSTDTRKLTVTKRATELTLKLDPESVVIGQESTVKVTVEDTSTGTKQTPTGIVTLTAGVTITGTCTLAEQSPGKASCTATASASAAGEFDIKAEFAETAVHQQSEDTRKLTVTKRATKLTLELDPPSVVIGQESTVKVTVEDTSEGTKQTPEGSVTLTADVTITGTCTLAQQSLGTATCTVTASASAAGEFDITAKIAETAVHQQSEDTRKLTVTKRETKTTVELTKSPIDEGSTTTVKVTVEDIETKGAKITPTGKVAVSSGESSFEFSGECTLAGSDGKASCSVTVKGKDGRKSEAITAQFSTTNEHLGSEGKATLTVNNVAPTIGTVTGLTSDPLPVGTTLMVTAPFTDPGVLDTHTCTVFWDGATGAAPVVTETDGSGDCTASATFNSAGVYKVVITITDKDGGAATYEYQYVVIYDPSAGFVTGGGWILSPPGAYVIDPTMTGKATFGFVSRYRKGAKEPEGNTEFQFHAAKMNFRSTSYQWLVVAGAKAQFKGFGTINGMGSYGFLLTATDGQMPGGSGVDQFRIKIWDIGSGMIVYDNALGASDDIDAANPQAISGGSIVIHSR